MSYNKNWPRWIEASVLKYVNDNSPPNSFVYYEGQERKTSNYHAWFEVRIDGPWAHEQSKDYWRLWIELNVLCSVDVGRDLYAIVRMAGAMGEIMDNIIPVFKLGNGPDDDGAVQIGCLFLDVREDRGIDIHKFGQIEPKTKLIQASVEARYRIDLEGG
jgi:hypothetical protein